MLSGCVDTLTSAQQLGVAVLEEEKEKQPAAKVYTKEDFSIVNRFESQFLCRSFFIKFEIIKYGGVNPLHSQQISN